MASGSGCYRTQMLVPHDLDPAVTGSRCLNVRTAWTEPTVGDMTHAALCPSSCHWREVVSMILVLPWSLATSVLVILVALLSGLALVVRLGTAQPGTPHRAQLCRLNVAALLERRGSL